MPCWNDILICPVLSTSFMKRFTTEEFFDLDGKFINIDGYVVFTFGKYQGPRIDEVAQESPGYLTWMLEQSFFEDAKALVRESLAGVSNRRCSVS